MGFLAFGSIVIVALIVGFAVQLMRQKPLDYEWLVVALSIGFGAYFASETWVGSALFEGITDWGWQFDGLYVIPAVIGALILAVAADLGVRLAPPEQLTA